MTDLLYPGKQILLLGAGFSRNWGGWLAAEAFEYLLGCPQIDTPLRDLLWTHRDSDGFEGALGELQTELIRAPGPSTVTRLRQMETAIAQMFEAMDSGFASVDFEFQTEHKYLVRTFLNRFDAIFTLNQDLLLERHYLNSSLSLGNPRQWSGWQMLGMRPEHTKRVHLIGGPGHENTGIWMPGGHPTVQDGLQPYVKLHGSMNWRAANDRPMIAMGGYKKNTVEAFPTLAQLHRVFEQYLMSGPVRLMVIGYGFGDLHINIMIAAAAKAGGLHMFIIDQQGINVLDKKRDDLLLPPALLIEQLGPSVRGASRRSLREIFGFSDPNRR